MYLEAGLTVSGKVICALVLTLSLTTSLSCGRPDSEPSGSVSPLFAGGKEEAPATGPVVPRDRSGTGSSDHRDGPVTSASTAPQPDSPGRDSATTNTAAAELQLLLDEYGRIVTEMAVDPAAAANPTGPVRSRWAAVVTAGSLLDRDVIDTLVTTPLVSNTRLLAPTTGPAYRHHLLDARLRSDGALDFTFCEFSLGVRVDSTSGSTVDGSRSEHRGVGLARPHGDGPATTWQLEELVSLEQRILSPDAEDPCS